MFLLPIENYCNEIPDLKHITKYFEKEDLYYMDIFFV